MQFTTVRSKEKDYDIYLKSEKLVHSQQQHEKNVSQLFGSGKNWFLAISSLTNTVEAIWREKSGSLLFGDKKMQFTTVRSKKNDYDIYLKSEKLVNSQQEHEKNVSQLFGSGKKLVPSYFEPDKHCCSYLEREKCGSLLFGHQKMQFTTVRSKENDYDIYLKSEKLVHSQQEHEKKCFTAIWKWKKLVPSYFEPDKHCCSYLEREKSGSLLFGDQKMQFTTVRSKKKDYDIYIKSEKLVHSQQEH